MPMKLNYYALIVACLSGCTPETAYEKLQHERPSTVVAQLSDDDLQDMQGMKLQGWTYRAIGELYGLTMQEVYGRLRYYKAAGMKRRSNGGN